MVLTFSLIWGVIFGVITIVLYEYCIKIISNKRKKNLAIRVSGFHIHHSIYGAILIIVYLFVGVPFLLGAGSGIIIHHTYNEKKFRIIDRT